MEATQRMMRRSPFMRCSISESEAASSLNQMGQSSMHTMEVITLSSAFSGLIWDWGAGCWTVGSTAAGSACAGGGAPGGWVAVGWMGTCCCWATDTCLRRALRAGAVGGAGLDGGGVATAFWGAGLPAATGTPPPATAVAAVMGMACTGCHTDNYTMMWTINVTFTFHCYFSLINAIYRLEQKFKLVQIKWHPFFLPRLEIRLASLTINKWVWGGAICSSYQLEIGHLCNHIFWHRNDTFCYGIKLNEVKLEQRYTVLLCHFIFLVNQNSCNFLLS